MKDITAILVQYSDQAVLNKALASLNRFSSRLDKVIIFQEGNRSFSSVNAYDWSNRTQYITYNGTGKALRQTVNTINSPYVLFLQRTDYLSSAATIQIPHHHQVLGTFHSNQKTEVHFPLLVRTSLLKSHSFLTYNQLPFKEALLPSWLSTVDTSLQLIEKDLTKQTRNNYSTTILEKQKFMQKYNLEKVNTGSANLSVIIPTYNMAAYVENAVVSCLLQNEQLEEILIMDDGSTDDSYEQIRRWHDGKQVKVFTKENGGKARALNDLLPHVTSDFILELDADDWLDPDAVSEIKKQLLKLPDDISVLYGNLRKWKQIDGDVLFKSISKGVAVKSRANLLSYRFPLGPRIYRTSLLKKAGGFPVITWKDGRLYEDISVLNRLIKNSRFQYSDFTVYNVRKHKDSITKDNHSNWKDFLKILE